MLYYEPSPEVLAQVKERQKQAWDARIYWHASSIIEALGTPSDSYSGKFQNSEFRIQKQSNNITIFIPDIHGRHGSRAVYEANGGELNSIKQFSPGDWTIALENISSAAAKLLKHQKEEQERIKLEIYKTEEKDFKDRWGLK